MLKNIIRRLRIAGEVATLGSNVFWKSVIFPLVLWLSLRHRLGFKDNLLIRCKLKKFGKPFLLYFTDASDVAIVREVFVKDDYEIDLKKEPKIIFDLGSNVGVSVIYFRLKYPNSHIFAFEPEPNTFQKLLRNVGNLKNVQTFPIAIAGENGRVNFYPHPNRSMSSSFQKRVPGQRAIGVKAKTLDKICTEQGIDDIDLIKFDIEGAELEVFRNFDKLNRVHNLIGELHLKLIDGTKENFYSLFQDNFSMHEIRSSTDQIVLSAQRRKEITETKNL